jgi:exopolysaccharide biosynthesis polyprenyl glycosylphosphotransferase
MGTYPEADLKTGALVPLRRVSSGASEPSRRISERPNDATADATRSLNPSGAVIFDQKHKVRLLLLDFAILALSLGVLLCTSLIFNQSEEPLAGLSLFNWVNGFAFTLVNLYVFGGYEIQASSRPRQIWLRGAFSTGVTVLGALAFGHWGGEQSAPPVKHNLFISTQILFCGLSGLVRQLLHPLYVRRAHRQRVLVLASQAYCAELERDFEQAEFNPMLIALAEPGESLSHQLLADELAVDAGGSWDEVIVAVESHTLGESLLQSLIRLRLAGGQVLDLCDFYESRWRKIPIYYIASQWFAISSGFGLLRRPFRQRLKRLFDIVVSSGLGLLALPLMILGCALVWLESPGPVIYRQVRAGRGGRTFSIFKIRSMILDAEMDGAQWARAVDSRVLRVGRILRKTRIDELPQLWNVLKGDMSFVGPRPERPEFNRELEKTIPFYDLRHAVQPGITGWAQVMYPYGASVSDSREKLQYDLYYIKNHSLFLDLQILLRTIRVVLGAAGR